MSTKLNYEPENSPVFHWKTEFAAAPMWWPAIVGAVFIAGPVFLLGRCSGTAIQKDRQAVARELQRLHDAGVYPKTLHQ